MRSIVGQSALLPARKLHAPTSAVIAIMCFAMILITAAGLALAQAAGSVAKGTDQRLIIELPGVLWGDLSKTVAAARAEAGVVEATPIPEAELRSTLKQWLGGAALSPDLPVPVLIAVNLKPGADAQALRAKLARQLPNASVVAEAGELGPLLNTIRGIQAVAAAIVVLVLVATAATVVLAARGGLDTHRATIEIMHGIGATDRQITRLFERKIATDAIVGAVAGTAAALIALLLLAGTAAAATNGLLVGVTLSWANLLLLALMPVLVVVLATAVAHWAIMKALRETL